MTDTENPVTPEAPVPVPLLAPRDGVPPVITDAGALAEAVAAFAHGSGPVAVDAERASGYRYGQRAYLIQLRRQGAGTALVDPVACPDLSALDAAIADAEWVLHAANQDLPCLGEVGMHPATVFDTELAARLAGYPRVGLGTMVEELLGFHLEKGHSAADWSTRPLPEPWLRYAALDVELLVDLRDALREELAAQGKLDWALEEFAAIAAAPPAAPRADPWRRTSGLHKVRRPRQLAAVRELWQARDATARERDVSPGRVLADAALIAAAQTMPASPQALAKVHGFGRMNIRQLRHWQQAIQRAGELPDAELPSAARTADGPPPPRAWQDRNPAAAARLAAAKAAVNELAERLRMPPENLITPDTVRRVAWEPPADGLGEAALGEALRARGARAWQVSLVAPLLADAFAA